MSYDDHLSLDARLVILKELAKQTDGRLNETILSATLDTFGYRKTRDWVRDQLTFLKEAKAVVVTDAGSVMIAAITRAGVDHVERRTIIEGIARPSPEV